MVRNLHIDAIETSAVPLIALENAYPDGFVLAAHRHRRGQLISGAEGVLALSTPQGRWVVPPGQGLWIPAGIVHEVRMIGTVTTRSLYLEPGQAGAMPGQCRVVGLSSFLRGLIAEAVELPLEHAPDTRAGALVALLIHELRALPELPLSLPLPAHPRLAERCRRFLARPTPHETIDQWRAPLGISRRAFTRLFRRETGLSFVEWRQQACLVAALPRLVAGEKVTSVALDLGYDNPAAFTTMFKRVLGAPPRAYLQGES